VKGSRIKFAFSAFFVFEFSVGYHRYDANRIGMISILMVGASAQCSHYKQGRQAVPITSLYQDTLGES
jgi:hypothetical protein